MFVGPFVSLTTVYVFMGAFSTFNYHIHYWPGLIMAVKIGCTQNDLTETFVPGVGWCIYTPL